jgi:cell fate regulator YaaT (PSP1 superfamily)
MTRTVGVRFRNAGKLFYYDALDFELEVGSYVIVDSAHGITAGRVVVAPDQVIANDASNAGDLKPVLRIATADDIERMQEMQARARDALMDAKKKASELELDMALASGEFDLEGSQFTAYFSAQERIDFRNLVRELSHDFGVRVQLLQVGDRDRAKLVDGFDICGERLCCSSWMTNFPSVSIRMAKEQDLPLNPQKISGVCGRLYCCLTFEYEDYRALRGTLPKVGSMISTPAGEAKVTGIDFNREMVKLYLTEQGEHVEVAAIDFQLQHGVTIRPMELVHKVEGSMRTIGEDSSARTTSRASSSSSASRAPSSSSSAPASPEKPAPERQGAGRNRRGGQRSRRNGQKPGTEATIETPAPRAERPATRPSQPAQPPAPQNETTAGEGEAKRRRRRRRRSRGGPPGEGGGSSESGSSNEE